MNARHARFAVFLLAVTIFSMQSLPPSEAQNLTVNQKMIKTMTYPPARKK